MKYRARTLDRMDDESLLALRFRDIEFPRSTGTVAVHMQRLARQLRARGIRFRPHYWYAEEWFSPDGVPGIALPFYLAHPRLMRLERRFMQQVEGGNSRWLLRILRHETGHALDTAYRLRERKDWREVFGSPHERYPQDYRPRPASRRHVLHLGHWYAQSHPTEDFAETFAVWLQPRARWRREYAGWPALRKLEYVDALMTEIARKRPLVRTRREVEPITHSTLTLAEHYRRKTESYRLDDTRYDRALRRLFKADDDGRHAAAAGYLKSVGPRISRNVAREAGLHPYVVEHTMEMLIHRLGNMHLHLRHDRRRAQRDFGGLVRRVAVGILKRNRENYAL
ncbi:MAG TPA: putative zinc-binding metallopeptidase [Steroidobacteraceae bacterium]|nr:putative zinc-binding metallopeptidase [Steroidobacteraceae bacterium]